MASSPLYFGGEKTDLGHVKSLPVASFSAFVKEILGHPALLPLTRQQYLDLLKTDEKSAKRAKQVKYVTAATFRASPSPRNYEHATGFNLVALDIDDSPVCRQTALALFRDPDQIASALFPWAFAAHITASSTKDAPRLRIYVASETLPVDSYHAAVTTVAKRLGLPAVTSESRVVVQPMYLPTIFRGEDPVADHPLLCAAPDGEMLKEEDLTGGTLPVERKGKAPSGSSDDMDDLDFLRPAVEGVTLAAAGEALSHLDPDMGYMEWLEVAAALRHQFPVEPEGSRAYELFDTWSGLGTKYQGTEETRSKWDSLQPFPKGRLPITIRTLFKRAQEAGWAPANLAQQYYEKTLMWLGSVDRNAHDLMADGVKRILATPLLSPLERGTLLNKLQDALAKNGRKVSRADLNKEIKHLQRIEAKAETDKGNRVKESQMPQWARGICYVMGTNEFFQRVTTRRWSPESLNNTFGVYLMDASAAETGRPLMRAQDYLLNVVKVPRVDHYRYAPAQGDQSLVTVGKHRFVNTYLPTFPEADEDHAEEVGSLFQQHVANLIAEPEYQHLLIDWLAYHVQSPGAKIRWAVLLQGAQGCGKTFLVDAMSMVLGADNVTPVDASLLITSPFNAWAYGSQIVAMEEVRIVGASRHEVMNRLKPCISNDKIAWHRKGKDPVTVPNVANYIMFTNHHDSLAVSEHDRRYFVLESKFQSEEQVAAELPPEYFEKLYSMVTKYPGALRCWLESWEISAAFKPSGRAPVTPYLKALADTSASPIVAAVRDAIADGENPLVQHDFVSTKCLQAILELQKLPPFTPQTMASALRELHFVNVGRLRVDKERHSLWARQGTPAAQADPAKLAEERMKAGPGVLTSDGEVVDFEDLAK